MSTYNAQNELRRFNTAQDEDASKRALAKAIEELIKSIRDLETRINQVEQLARR